MSLPETRANTILDELGINSPEDLLLLRQIVRARGVRYREEALDGTEARLTVGAGAPIMTISTSRETTPQRKRFSIGHELGHKELHADRMLSFSCLPNDIQYKPDLIDNVLEQEANQFAASFLMPARFVEYPFSQEQPSFDLIRDWSNRLQTSLTATALRFVTFSQEPIAVIFSQGGIIRYFEPSPEFLDLEVFPDVHDSMGQNTIASRIFRGVDTKSEWKAVKASDWFRENPDAYDPTDTILEWSIGMRAYNAVLSLLWVNEPLGNDPWF